MKHVHKKMIRSAITIAILALIAWGLYLLVSKPNVQIGGNKYPAAFIAANLPEYKDAWLTNPGKNPTDAYFSIRLRSKKPIKEVHDFYEASLLGAGWQSPASPIDNGEGFIVQTFNKGNKSLTLQLDPQGDEVSIALVYSNADATSTTK